MDEGELELIRILSPAIAEMIEANRSVCQKCERAKFDPSLVCREHLADGSRVSSYYGGKVKDA